MKVTTPVLNIGLVDDHNLFRKGLIKLINMGNAERRYNILFEADNGNDLKVKMAAPPFPDIVLMDIEMPGMDGFESVEWLRRTHPAVKVLVISMVDSEEGILRMLRLGVRGYLSKAIEVEDMHQALEAIAGNGIFYSDFANEVLTNQLNGVSKTDKAAPHTSENEREFLKLAATDMTYYQIAEKMNLSPKTIDGYREALFTRFNVKNRAALVVYAIKNKIIKL